MTERRPRERRGGQSAYDRLLGTIEVEILEEMVERDRGLVGEAAARPRIRAAFKARLRLHQEM